MITLAIIIVLLTIFNFILEIIPALPQFPDAITDVLNFLINFLGGMFGFIVHIYTPVLAGAIVAMCLALLFFNQGYHVVMFVLKKLHITG